MDLSVYLKCEPCVKYFFTNIGYEIHQKKLHSDPKSASAFITGEEPNLNSNKEELPIGPLPIVSTKGLKESTVNDSQVIKSLVESDQQKQEKTGTDQSPCKQKVIINIQPVLHLEVNTDINSQMNNTKVEKVHPKETEMPIEQCKDDQTEKITVSSSAQGVKCKNPSQNKSTFTKKSAKKCDICNIEFMHLRNHFKQVHLKIRSYRCQICERAFHRKPSMNKHIKRVHEKAEMAY